MKGMGRGSRSGGVRKLLRVFKQSMPCTSLLSCVVGRTVGPGLEERERGAGWEIAVVVQVKKK